MVSATKNWFQQIYLIESFITLAVLRQSTELVWGVRLRVIAPRSTAPFEDVSKRWLAVGNTSDSTGPRFEPWTSSSRDERVIARQIFPFIEKFCKT